MGNSLYGRIKPTSLYSPVRTRQYWIRESFVYIKVSSYLTVLRRITSPNFCTIQED